MQSITQVWCIRPFCYCSGFTFSSWGVIIRLPRNACQLTPPFYSFMSVYLFLFRKGSCLVHRLVQVQALGVIANEHCMLPWVLIMEEKRRFQWHFDLQLEHWVLQWNKLSTIENTLSLYYMSWKRRKRPLLQLYPQIIWCWFNFFFPIVLWSDFRKMHFPWFTLVAINCPVQSLVHLHPFTFMEQLHVTFVRAEQGSCVVTFQ